MLQCVFGKELDHCFCQLSELFEVFIRFKLHERHHHGTHKVADLQGTFAADKDRNAFVVAA